MKTIQTLSTALFVGFFLVLGHISKAQSSKTGGIKHRISLVGGLNIPLGKYEHNYLSSKDNSIIRGANEIGTQSSLNYQLHFNKNFGLEIGFEQVKHTSYLQGRINPELHSDGNIYFGLMSYSRFDLQRTTVEREIPRVGIEYYPYGDISWRVRGTNSYTNLRLGTIVRHTFQAKHDRRGWEMACIPFIGMSYRNQLPSLSLNYSYQGEEKMFYQDGYGGTRVVLAYGASAEIMYKIKQIGIGFRGSFTGSANYLYENYSFRDEQVYHIDAEKIVENNLSLHDRFKPSYVNLSLLLSYDLN